MHRARARTAAALTVLALTAGLGACTSAPPPPPAAEGAAGALPPDPRADAAPVLHDVIDAMNKAGTAQSTVHGKLGLVGELTGDGAVDYRQPQPDLSLHGHTQLAPGHPQEPVEVVLADGVGHINSPLIRPEPDKPWIVITPGGTDFTAQLFGPALRQLANAVDPRSTFHGIEDSTKISATAHEDVNGHPATRYDLSVLTAPAAKTASDPQNRDQLRHAAETGKPELAYQLWVGEDGLPLRFAAVQDVAQAGQVSLSTTYRDWGSEVTVQPPPADRIGEFRDLPPMAAPPG